MSALYIFVGYPGAGKTTIAQYIHDLTGGEHIWADQERKKRFGSPTHSEHETRELYNRLNIEVDHLLAEGKSVIYDTNFNYYKDREHMRNLAAKHGVKAVLIWLTTSKDLSKSRATTGEHASRTRILGNMSAEDFDTIARHLEPPRPEEQAMQIDGSGYVSETQVKELLGL